MKEINDLKDEVDKLTKAKDKYKLKIAELEKEKSKQADEYNLRSKTESHMTTMNNNRIDDLNKNIFSLTKKVMAS